jgi:hypothetical protein
VSNVEGATGSVLDAGMLAGGDVLTLYDPKELDFPGFFAGVAAASCIVRMQVCYQLATDPAWAQREFKAYSANGRLQRIAAVLTGEIVVGEGEQYEQSV